MNIVIQGWNSSSDFIVLGYAGQPTTEETTNEEYFHSNTLRHSKPEEIQLDFTIPLTDGAGEVVTRLRGPGNFGIFRKAHFDKPGFKVEIFQDADLSQKIAEFNS